MSDLVELALKEAPELIRLRRAFHRRPEPSYAEHQTAALVAETLGALGLRVTRPEGMTGLWADLDAPGAGERLLFRADMDALCMTEKAAPAKAGFLSETPGLAHCCGHDAHMAILLAAARMLAGGALRPRRSVRFLFQHAEESHPGGALELIEAGCLEGVQRVFGGHVFPTLPAGTFALMPGPVMAATDDIRITVQGRGGHAAMPHLLLDPVVAAAHVVAALQHLASRRASPLQALVVSIATIQGGSGTNNVIPDEVRLLGTARTLDTALWERVPGLVEDCAVHAARALGCEAAVDYARGYPVLVNEAGCAAEARQAAAALFGADALLPEPSPLMAGEDFAYYARMRPACYAFFGAGNAVKGITAPNHAAEFDLDEEQLYRAAAWFAALACR